MNETSISPTATTALHDPSTVSEAVVDPDALDDLVASTNRWSDESPGRVVFPYAGYEVTVSASGDVSVEEAAQSERHEA